MDEKKNDETADGDGRFKVSDRRKFSSAGERKDETAGDNQVKDGQDRPKSSTADPEAAAGAAETASSGAEKEPAAGPAEAGGDSGTDPSSGNQNDGFDPEAAFMEVSFANFILSLGTSAMLHFGEVPDPVSGKAEQNLPLAKHTIDALDMLKEKTAGNLTEDEEKLLSDLLYQLRMKYISLT